MKLINTHNLGFIIVPGNPGINKYYEIFGSELVKLYKGSILEIITYRGFDTKSPNRCFSVLEEKEFIQSSIERIIYDPINIERRWVVIGHSIGGWIVLNILNEWKTNKNSNYLKVISGILLFPFLSLNSNSIQQSKLNKKLTSSNWVKIVLLMYSLIKHLPKSIIQFALKVITRNMEVWTLDITYFYFIELNHIPASILHLAKTEFQTLPKDLNRGKELTMIKNCKEIIYLFYTNQDLWAPLSHRNEILNYMGEEFANRIITDGNLNHDFCVRNNQSSILAKRIYDIVEIFH